MGGSVVRERAAGRTHSLSLSERSAASTPSSATPSSARREGSRGEWIERHVLDSLMEDWAQAAALAAERTTLSLELQKVRSELGLAREVAKAMELDAAAAGDEAFGLRLELVEANADAVRVAKETRAARARCVSSRKPARWGTVWLGHSAVGGKDAPPDERQLGRLGG